MKTRICCQSGRMAGNGAIMARMKSAMAAILGAAAKKAVDRRRRALIDVGRPHVERHGRDLEGKAGDQEDEAEDEAEARPRPPVSAAAISGKAGRAGEAIDQRGAIEQHARGQRAEDEIFEAGFGGAGVVAVDGGDDIERQRLQFEAHIERDEIVGRDHHHHADGREQDEDGIFEALDLLGFMKLTREARWPTAEPNSVSTFMTRAKVSTTKAPPKAVRGVPPPEMTSSHGDGEHDDRARH